MVKSIQREFSICSIDSRRASTLKIASLARGEPQTPKPVRLNTCFHYYRYIVVAFAGLFTGWMFLLRLAINVAMISMVNKTAIYMKEHPNGTVEDFFPPDYKEEGEFVWTNEIQQLVMTGYMVSYAIPQYSATRLSIKYGMRRSLPVSLAICSISNVLTPPMAYWGWQWVLALRLLNGVGASAVFPSMLSLIEIWLPEEDVSRGFALFQFTSTIIQVLAPLISGYCAVVHWQWAFYVPGAIGLMLCIIWLLIVTDEPATCKFISQKENDHIYGCKYEADSSKDQNKEMADQRAALSWYFVFKIRNFYPLCVAVFMLDATEGGFYFIMPTYFHRILGTSTGDIGLVNFIVQISTVFCVLWPDPSARLLQRAFGISLTSARRIVSTICSSMVIVTFLYLAKYHDDLMSVITVNRFFHVSKETIIVGTILSQFSAEKLTGLVYSVVNAVGNLSVLICCWEIGRYLDYAGESLESWSLILIWLAGLNVIYLINYCLFCPSRPVHVELPPLKKPLGDKQCKQVTCD